jgi:ERCC4-related helicase
MEDCKGRILLSPLSEIQKKWMNLTSIHRLVYDCPSHLDPSIEFTIENVPKLGSLDSLLKDECADADSILIFVPYKEAQSKLKEWLTNKGHSVRVLNGDITNVKDRESIIQGFKNKEYRILITSVQKGLNFGDCNHCIFYSFNPNPAGMIQFEARTTRSFDIIGKNVFVLCSMGKEYKRLNEVLKERARATADMARADISVIMSILLEEMD